MEDLAGAGFIDGILDMSLHEITSGYFGGGFSYGPRSEIRLTQAVRNRVPLVVTPGGLDFVDFALGEFPDRMDERVYMMHNHKMAHIKILLDEARSIAREVKDRLAAVDYPVRLLLPTEGMRGNTGPGEELYQPEVDAALLGELKMLKNPWVQIKEISGNLNTESWGREAAREMLEELKEAKARTEVNR